MRQPHNTAERQKQKMVGRGEFIIDQTNNIPGDNNSYQDSGYASTAANGGNGLHREHEIMNSNGNNYSPDPLLHLQRPNSIEVNRAYEQQVQQQQMQQRMASVNLNTNGNAGYTQEPIYTPHVLRGNSGDEPPSHRYNPQPSQQTNYPPTAMFGRTQDNNMDSQPHAFNPHLFLEATPATTAAAAQQQQLNQQPQLQQFNPGYQYQQQSQTQQNQSPVGTPSKSNGGQRRPSQPPPAPPPGGALSPTPSAGTPTRNGPTGSRGNSSQRDSLPPPPPPPGTTSTPISGNKSSLSDTQQQLHHNLMNGLHHQFNNTNSNSPPKPLTLGSGIGSSNPQSNLNHNLSNVSNTSAANHSTSSIAHDESLPPPPPVPDTAGNINSANNSLNVKMNNLEHLLPPSPPPPPAPSSAVSAPASSSTIPPPPPPPPSDLGSNGITLNPGNHIRSGKMNGDIKSGVGSPQKSSILSPPGLRKPVQPSHLKAQDGVRSDLLKAIRDGKRKLISIFYWKLYLNNKNLHTKIYPIS